MKRSDMVEIIMNAIDLYDVEVHSTIGDSILTAMEEAGMMPPTTEHLDYVGHGTRIVTENSWEKE